MALWVWVSAVGGWSKNKKGLMDYSALIVGGGEGGKRGLNGNVRIFNKNRKK